MAGKIRIVAKQTDTNSVVRKAEFTCQAHSTRLITPIEGHWETIYVTDGLSGSSIWSILQDSNGVLWFGSMRSGLCRYDGRTFQTFTTADGLPSNNIYTIFEGAEGQLWFGTKDIDTQGRGAGVCWYDGSNFHTLTTEDGLIDNGVMAIHQDNLRRRWNAEQR